MTDKEAEQQSYLTKFPILANECLITIANDIKPNIKKIMVDGELLTTTEEDQIITLPDDFLSFPSMINYLDGEADPTIVYVGNNQLLLPKIGTYTIFYNALYPIITDITSSTADINLEIPQSVLNLLPSYVASQCLAQDDVQRSAILRNEYELMLSRLDDNIMYESNHFKSSGG